jgi:hypothetical protein
MIKRLLRITIYILSTILLIGLIFYLRFLYVDWQYRQHYDKVVTFYCRHKFVGCANENEDFEVYKVENKDFSFLLDKMVSLRWKNNPRLDKLRKSDAFLTQDFIVKGIVYKHQFDVAVSPLYDCELYAYRVDIIEMRPLRGTTSNR